MQVAREIPGCSPRSFTGISVYAADEVTCDVSGPNAGTFWVATFTSSGHETSFLTTGGGNLRAMQCIEGTDWAVVISTPATTFREVAAIAVKMGGRVVVIGACS